MFAHTARLLACSHARYHPCNNTTLYPYRPQDITLCSEAAALLPQLCALDLPLLRSLAVHEKSTAALPAPRLGKLWCAGWLPGLTRLALGVDLPPAALPPGPLELPSLIELELAPRLGSTLAEPAAAAAAGWRLPALRGARVRKAARGCVAPLLAAAWMPGLRSLTLELSPDPPAQRRRGGGGGAEWRVPQLACLTSLELTSTGLGESSLRAVLAAAPGLRQLSLCGQPLGGARPALAAARLGALTSLWLSSNGLTPAGLRALARARWFSNLESLHITSNKRLGDAGLSILCGERLPRLASFCYSYCGVGSVQAFLWSLARTPWIAQLSLLQIGGPVPAFDYEDYRGRLEQDYWGELGAVLQRGGTIHGEWEVGDYDGLPDFDYY